MKLEENSNQKKIVITHFGKKIKIPNTWEFQTLDKIISISKKRGIPNNYPYIEIGDIDTQTKKYQIKDKKSVSNCLLARKNEIIISKVRPTRGAISEISHNEIMVSYAFAVISSKDKKIVNDKFLFFFLSQKSFFDYLGSKERGTSYPSCKDEDILKFNILIPKIKEQVKIAQILSNLTELISIISESIEKNIKIKNGITKKLLSQDIEHKKSKNVSWYFGKNLQIPSTCDLIEFGTVCKKITKGIFDLSPKNYVEKGIPFLRISDIQNNLINLDKTQFITSEKSNASPTSELGPGDMVIAKVGASAGSLEKIAIIPPEIKKCNISQNLIGIKFDKSKCDPHYFMSIISSQKFMNVVLSRSNTTTFKSIQLGVLRELLIPIPKIEEQIKIVEKIQNIEKNIVYLKYKMSTFENIKKGLMQKLLTGIIRVKI